MIATAAEPTTAPATTAGHLLLARLLPPTKRLPSPARIRADVARFFRQPPSDERWQETIDGLVRGGLLTTKPLRLTDAGRARALDFLGVSELPPRSNWGTMQAKFLAPQTLGIAPAAQEARKRIEKADNLAALLLKRRFELCGTESASLGEILEALACREICRKLGFPDAPTLKDVKARVLSRLIESDEPLDAEALRKKLPRVLLGAKRAGVAGLREVAFHGWADGPASPQSPLPVPETRAPAAAEPAPADFDLPAFAQTVMAAARDCPTGRFGDNKVFISHVWRRLRDEPGFPTMELSTFKQRLTEANNAGLLTLSRADLVQLMDPAYVQESQTRYLNAEFHFVLLEKEQP